MKYALAFYGPSSTKPAMYTGTKFSRKGKAYVFPDRSAAGTMLARLARNHATVKKQLLRGRIHVVTVK